VATAGPVSSVRDAKTAINDVKANHPNATHVVYAYLIGPSESETAGMSDAGEPHGTAGRPVLSVLRGTGITDCLVTVVRYFGGTKLGTGGLVHAYSDAVRVVLEQMPTRPRVARRSFSVTVPYSLEKPILSCLVDQHSAVIESETFGTDVEILGAIPQSECDGAVVSVRDLSAGTVDIVYTS
jgi:uncharacterized YigZ family protein